MDHDDKPDPMLALACGAVLLVIAWKILTGI